MASRHLGLAALVLLLIAIVVIIGRFEDPQSAGTLNRLETTGQ